MTELLDELTELDRRHQAGSLSEHAYRRARERLIEDHAMTGGHGPAHGLRDREGARPKRRRRPERTGVDRTGVDRTGKKRPDEGYASRAPQRTGRNEPAVRRGGSPALDALLLLIVAVAFSEALAQMFGNGLPYHRIDGQLIYLPGPGLYALRALEAGGNLGGQMLLAVILTPCYLVIPWGTYRALSKPGGIGQLFAGYTIALRYMVVSAVVSFVYLAVINNYPIDPEQHLLVPGLIGIAILGTVLAVVILLRRLVSR